LKLLGEEKGGGEADEDSLFGEKLAVIPLLQLLPLLPLLPRLCCPHSATTFSSLPSCFTSTPSSSTGLLPIASVLPLLPTPRPGAFRFLLADVVVIAAVSSDRFVWLLSFAELLRVTRET
jgi:hypothetical protein